MSQGGFEAGRAQSGRLWRVCCILTGSPVLQQMGRLGRRFVVLAVALLVTVVAAVGCASTPLSAVEQLRGRPVRSLAFASCNQHSDRHNPAFDSVVALRPDMFVWLGDAVYGDTRTIPHMWYPSPLPVMKAKYDALKGRADYANISANGIPIVGIYGPFRSMRCPRGLSVCSYADFPFAFCVCGAGR
jgi:hypothetical protein